MLQILSITKYYVPEEGSNLVGTDKYKKMIVTLHDTYQPQCHKYLQILEVKIEISLSQTK